MTVVEKITPCLWFDGQAEEAVNFYASIFADSAIETVTRFSKAGFEHHGRPEGSVMTVTFRVCGQQFTALNGGPQFKFSEAVSFIVRCDSQDEVDRYWDALSEGGDPSAQACGWLKDKFGVTWQVVPGAVFEMITKPAAGNVEAMMGALMDMKKLDLAALQKAYRAA